MIRLVCDECGGEPVVYSAFLYTGRVYKDGKDMGQHVDLCAVHAPIEENQNQPNNCIHISFDHIQGSVT